MRFGLAICLFMAVSPLHAQTAALDPPMTSAERQAVEDSKKMFRKSGLSPMTDEQAVMLIQAQRNARVQGLGALSGLRSAFEQMPPKSARFTEAATIPVQPTVPTAAMPAAPASAIPALDMAAEISARSGNNAFTRFERRGDGFLFDGKPFIDADGEITEVGSNAMTGWVTYLVDVGGGQFLVKHHNVRSNLSPIVIGQVTEQGGHVKFRSYNGQTAGGDGIIPTSQGILVVRDESLFNYNLTKGLTPINVPVGFRVAKYQHGDVAGTGFVLLERIDTVDNPVHNVKKIGASIGSLFGKEKSYDYALLDLASQAAIPVNISMDGKEVGEGAGCQARNAFVNSCSGWRSWESIWTPDGRPNLGHYYWGLSWFASKHGPVAVAQENGLKDVNVITLANGNRYNAFHRGMGINGFTAEPTAEASVRITARIVFKTEELNDLSALLGGSPTSTGTIGAAPK